LQKHSFFRPKKLFQALLNPVAAHAAGRGEKLFRHLLAASALAALFAGVLPEKVDFDFFRFD
jgi:hypothetical protein